MLPDNESSYDKPNHTIVLTCFDSIWLPSFSEEKNCNTWLRLHIGNSNTNCNGSVDNDSIVHRIPISIHTKPGKHNRNWKYHTHSDGYISGDVSSLDGFPLDSSSPQHCGLPRKEDDAGNNDSLDVHPPNRHGNIFHILVVLSTRDLALLEPFTFNFLLMV